MHRIGAVAIVLLLALWAGVILAQNESAMPVPYVYRLKISGCTFDPVDRRQTGFRVQGMAGIVTALHGVADCQSVTAVPDDGIPFTDLVITAVDIERDIALLTSPALVDHPLDGLVPSTLTAHELLTTTLRVVGYPLGLDKQDADLIESVRAVESLDAVIPEPEEPADFLKRRSPDINIDVLNLQAQLLPGHSGAPVIDQASHIIAVGNGGLRGGTVERSWAIPWPSVQLASVEEDEVKEKLATLAAKNITALSFSSTYPSSPETTGTLATYMVQVVGMNQQPIANAEILLTHSAGYEIGMTDSEGFYTFHLPTSVSYVQSQIQVEAPGYPLYNRTLSNVLGKVGAEIVRLTGLRLTPSPVASGFCEFAFLILDEESEQPIADADLTVTLGSRLATGKTDKNGFYESKLPCTDPFNVSVRVRIQAEGYKQHSEIVTLVGEVKEMLLVPIATPTPLPTSTSTATPTPTPQPTATITPLIDLKSLNDLYRRAEQAALLTFDPRIVDGLPLIAHGQALADLQSQLTVLTEQQQYQILSVEEKNEDLFPLNEQAVSIRTLEERTVQTFERTNNGSQLLQEETFEAEVIYGLILVDGLWKVDQVKVDPIGP